MLRTGWFAKDRLEPGADGRMKQLKAAASAVDFAFGFWELFHGQSAGRMLRAISL
jgi:hypothetical protein